MLAVGDRSRDPYGLCPADWDLLSRVPGLERIDVVVTDAALAGAFHERIHQLLPGIEEVRLERDGDACRRAAGATRRRAGRTWRATARRRSPASPGWVKQLHARGDADAPLDRTALVVRQPLPYVYVAREVLRSAGIPCQMFDALPLAAEPYAAALDLVFSFVSANFARVPAIALLRSPHFRFAVGNDSADRCSPRSMKSPRSIAR